MASKVTRTLVLGAAALFASLLLGSVAQANEAAALKSLPNLGSDAIKFFGMSGQTLLTLGLLICVAGGAFGLVIYNQLKNMPVHQSMLEISELIYETCKTYLLTQIKFIAILGAFIGAVIVLYFGWFESADYGLPHVAAILIFAVVGVAGSIGVAWFGIRVNTFANSRSAFASLAGKPFPTYAIPLKAGMSIGMLLIATELIMMLIILLAGSYFTGFK